ncbi:MAG: hypothetical protein K8I30_14060 [Anaerolineae bacterium]|nr:hypothetical protein [Anaerolineae bacterium]
MSDSRRWKLLSLVIFTFVIAAGVGVQSALALTINGLVVTLGCTDWSYNAYNFVTDRDNTGATQEAYDIIITDGAGTVLHQVGNNGVAIGGPYFDGPSGVIAYNTAVPQYNPITFTWISRAGGIYPSPQIAFTATGSCTGLPTYTAPQGSSGVVIDGEVQFDPGDDRLNRENKDRAAPVAIYCMEWGVEVRVIEYATSRGIDPPAITALYPDVEAVGVPGANTLLGEGSGVQLYRLTSGEFAVFATYANENKAYIFVWDQCPVPTIKYHAAV